MMSLDTHRCEACHFPCRSITQTPYGRDINVTFYLNSDFAQSNAALTSVCHVPHSKACTQCRKDRLGWVRGCVFTKQMGRLINHHGCEIAYICEIAELPFSNRSCF